MVGIKIPKQTILICHGWEYTEFQELMNRHSEKERLTSVYTHPVSNHISKRAL